VQTVASLTMYTSFRIRLPVLALLVALGAVCFFPGTAAAGDGRQAIPPIVTSERTPDIPALTRAELAVRYALDAVGTPYRWGGESPSSGFDCSGLVRWAYGRVGVDLPHSSYALYGEGHRVREGNMEPGDILFFEGLGHVGLYLGSGRMVHAPQTGRNVEIVRLGSTNYGSRLMGARRIVAA
jgi:cell wall-associated NlpC family hydrolase